MFPLKDTLPSRGPVLVTLALVALTLVAIPTSELRVAIGLLSAWAVWIAGRSLEDCIGRLPFLLLAVIAAGAALALSTGPAPVVAAVTCGGYLAVYPRVKVQTVSFVPGLMALLEAPVLAVAAAWLVAMTALSLTTAGGDIAPWVPATGMLCGMLAVPLFGPDRNPAYGGHPGVVADSVPPS